MQPSSSRRERILVYGRSGAGKSSTWASLAQWISDTDTESLIHLGDTDNAWDAIQYEELEKYVTQSHITNYRDALQWARKTRDNVQPTDWVVFDMIDKAWAWAQEHYFSTIMGDDDLMLGDVYVSNQIVMAKPKGEREGGMAGEHGSNWGVIYKYYH